MFVAQIKNGNVRRIQKIEKKTMEIISKIMVIENCDSIFGIILARYLDTIPIKIGNKFEACHCTATKVAWGSTAFLSLTLSTVHGQDRIGHAEKGTPL